MTDTTKLDHVAMAVSSGLMVTGVVLLGVVEILAGQPYGASPAEVTNDAGQVVGTMYPAVDPVVRTGLVLAGLLVLGAWAAYRAVVTDAPTVRPHQQDTRTPRDTGAD